MSAKVIVKHPTVLPRVPAKVSKKLGFSRPLSKLGGVNLDVKVVMVTSMISIPMNVIANPIK